MNPQAGVTVLNSVGNESYGGAKKVGKMASKQTVEVPELNIPDKFQVFKRGKPFSKMATNK